MSICQWEYTRILKWRYVRTIFLAIFCGDIHLHRPEKEAFFLWNRYLHFRILKFPLNMGKMEIIRGGSLGESQISHLQMLQNFVQISPGVIPSLNLLGASKKIWPQKWDGLMSFSFYLLQPFEIMIPNDSRMFFRGVIETTDPGKTC